MRLKFLALAVALGSLIQFGAQNLFAWDYEGHHTVNELALASLPPLRYDFVAVLAKARAAHPERFPAIDPEKDADHTRELDGFLPWAITENYEKLKSDFSCLKAFQTHGGTPEEIANAQADVVYMLGVRGHLVGDVSQTLHTLQQFNWLHREHNP